MGKCQRHYAQREREGEREREREMMEKAEREREREKDTAERRREKTNEMNNECNAPQHACAGTRPQLNSHRTGPHRTARVHSP